MWLEAFSQMQQKTAQKAMIRRGILLQTEGVLRGASLRRENLSFITSRNLRLLPREHLQGALLLLFRLLDLHLTPLLRRFIIDADGVRAIEPGTIISSSLLLPCVTFRETVSRFEEALLQGAPPKKIALVANPLRLLLI